jgi:DNA-binding NtrC family response regulator
MKAVDQTILLVEDDAPTRKGLEALLTSAGYRVVVAADFAAGRRALFSKPPDLVLTDIRLGEFNGLQLLALSSIPIPAIVITGFADPVLEDVARSLGAVFVLKPIVPSALLELVADRLAQPQASPAPR